LKLKYNQSASPQILSDLSSVYAKKVGDFFEMESKSLIKSGMKIPRSYYNGQEVQELSWDKENTVVKMSVVHRTSRFYS